MRHLSVRALQVLEGRERDGELAVVCRERLSYEDLLRREGEEFPIIAEHDMIEAFKVYFTRKWRPPAWATGKTNDYDSIDSVTVCPDCWPPSRGPFPSAFLIAADGYLEQPLPEMLPIVPPPPRSESVVSTLFAWIKKTGPKRKYEMQEFVFQRAYPGAAEFIEINDRERGLVFHRQSSVMWGTNFAVLARQGRMVKLEDGRWDVP